MSSKKQSKNPTPHPENEDEKQHQELVRAYALTHYAHKYALKHHNQTKKVKRPQHSFRKRNTRHRKRN